MAQDLDENVIPPARGKQTRNADFARNRNGLYGGLPKARDRAAADAKPKDPHPPRDRTTPARRPRRPRV